MTKVSFAALISILWLNQLCLAVEPYNEVLISAFGATGDGQTDDYSALIKGAEYLSTHPHTILRFPAGVYYINQLRIYGQNPPPQIVYKNCNDVHIIGERGAVISVKGDFFKPVVSKDAGKNVYRTDREQVIPFYFWRCNNFSVSGLEIKGNVDKMTRERKEIGETSGFGILTKNCKNYTLSNLDIHHFSTDGLELGMDEVVADENVHLSHISSRNNARQGLTIVHARHVTVSDSEFSDTGRTGGSYGGHSPQAGVDIEPYSQRLVGQTEDIHFRRCRMLRNKGAQFVAGRPDKTKNITIKESNLVAAEDSSVYSVLFGIKGARLENCFVNTGKGAIYPVYEGHFPNHERNAVLLNNNILTQGQGIVATGSSELYILKNRIFGRHSGPISGDFPSLTNGKTEFMQNALYYPAALYTSAERTLVKGRIERASRVEANTYSAHLPVGHRFLISYDHSLKIQNEIYHGKIGPK